MGSIEILDSLYMNPGRKIGLYETEKSHIALWSHGSSPPPRPNFSGGPKNFRPK